MEASEYYSHSSRITARGTSINASPPSFNGLTRIFCPANIIPRYDLSAVEKIEQGNASPTEAGQLSLVPKYVISLGDLHVRTTTQYPKLLAESATVAEFMDYHVNINVGNAALLAWILTSHIELRDHAEE